MTPESLRAARFDPRTEREWRALEIAQSGDLVTYLGRRTDDGLLLVAGGSLPGPLAIEADPLTVLRTLALDVVRRRPGMRLDAEEMAVGALARLRLRLAQQKWAVSEVEIVAD